MVRTHISLYYITQQQEKDSVYSTKNLFFFNMRNVMRVMPARFSYI